jgi:hypothetical protein
MTRLIDPPAPAADVRRSRALLTLAVITAVGAALRFYNLAWGAPYYHFHMDEHYVFMGADLLRQSLRDAALSGKFFMYGPLPMYLVNIVRSAYEAINHPLVLSVPRDEVTYMVLGRAISAAFATATIPIVYSVATRVAGRVAGLLAAAYLAVSVLHIRDAHFFSVDISMTFFCMLTWLALMRMAERGTIASGVHTGLAFGAALVCKYTAMFMAVPIALAHIFSPDRPRSLRPYDAWGRWALRGMVPVAVTIATFFVLDPMVLQYWDKFLDDVRTQITEPHTGTTRPIYLAHFADLSSARLYWFTNLLWWGIGPALEIWSLSGVVWLLTRRSQPALLAAAVPIAYYAVAGNSVAPFVRYAVPLVAALAVAAGVLSADLMRRPRWRRFGIGATAVVLTASALWAIAYMNIFRSPDSRLQASAWLQQNVPQGAAVLVEPSHNIPPTGSYLTDVDFHQNYVLFYPETERRDYYHLYAFDTYRSLYNRGPSDDWRREYIQSRLALVDWIVIDDTYVQWYEHLPAPDHSVVKQHYRDLFAGKLGFKLVKTFKVYPSLFGWEINDDAAELTFRLFDHPRVFIFLRQ